MADDTRRRAIAHAVDGAALVAASPGVDLASGSRRRDSAGHAGPRRRRRGAPTTRSAHASCSPRPASPRARAFRRCSSALARGRRPRARRTTRSHRRAAQFETHAKCSASGRAHAWFSGWHADYPDPDGFYLGCSSSASFFRDEATDGPRARACLRDRDERLRLYREFERVWIGERAAIVPISYSRQLIVRRPNVHGLRLNPMGAFHLEQVVIDPLRTPRSVPDLERQHRGGHGCRARPRPAPRAGSCRSRTPCCSSRGRG